MPIIEYPKWIYPLDGGPGKIIETPAEWTEGWSDKIVTVPPPIAEPIEDPKPKLKSKK